MKIFTQVVYKIDNLLKFRKNLLKLTVTLSEKEGITKGINRGYLI